MSKFEPAWDSNVWVQSLVFRDVFVRVNAELLIEPFEISSLIQISGRQAIVRSEARSIGKSLRCDAVRRPNRRFNVYDVLVKPTVCLL